MSIRDRKLIYHLTSLDNLDSILEEGLLSREEMEYFDDVANPEIILFRKENGLNNLVPFHFFTGNPFDGRVQIDYPDKEFVYITLRRKYAEDNSFKIIPMHPKAMRPLKVYEYTEGFVLIEWDIMDTKNYLDEYCKHVCMAECLSPRGIRPEEFFAIYVKSEKIKQKIKKKARRIIGSVPFYVDVMEQMFLE